MNSKKILGPSSRKHYRKCVICGRKQNPGDNLRLSRLPLDPIRCRKWVQAIGDEDLVYVPIEKLNQLKYVCHAHFSPQCYTKSRLNNTAVPTLNLERESLPEHIFKDFPFRVHNEPAQHVLKDITNTGKGDSTITYDQSAFHSTPGPSVVLAETSKTAADMSILTEASTSYRSEGPSGVVTEITSKTAADMSILSEASTSYRSEGISAIPGSSTSKYVDTVTSYKRMRRSTESKDVKQLKGMDLEKNISNCDLKKISNLDVNEIESKVLKNLLNAAISNEKKKPQGKRWELETKVWALGIFKRSPKTYRFLQASLPLPSPKTITRLLKTIPMEPGINTTILNSLSEKVAKMADIDKHCAILFDEMSLKKRLFYNECSDKVEGFEDFGLDDRSSKIADHVMVFMIQGIARKYKQPIAYYFVKGTTSSGKLSVLIKSVINAVNEVGLKVVCTTCDQGPTNMGALTLLKRDPQDNYFYANNSQIFIMFDVPHLFKSIRNNFLNAGEMHYDGKTAKWAHLLEAEARNQNFLNFQKITKTVVQPSFKTKMKVKHAAHALSNTMAAVLKMLSWKNNNTDILKTAEVIEEMDKLFDLTNGPKSSKDVKKGIRINVSKNTIHVEQWNKYLRKLDSIKFTKKDSHIQLKNVRCINGYKTTLKSLKDIWFLLQKENFRFLNLRQLTQDSLENMFSVIRQHGITNTNPTCTLFTAALKTYLVSGWTSPHNRGSNCEADNNKLLLNFKLGKMRKDRSAATQNIVSSEPPANDDVPVLSIPDEDDIEDIESLYRFEEQAVVYVSGFVAKKMLALTNNCMSCKRFLISENPEDDDLYKYISLREWTDKQCLTYPSKDMCRVIKFAEQIFIENISNQLYFKNVKELYVLTFVEKININWFKCTKHKDIPFKIFQYIATLFIRKECKIRNNEFSMSESKSADAMKKAQQQSLLK